MSGIVLDASAALALLRGEPSWREVAHQLRTQAEAHEAILVPPLFWLEVVNVLTRRYRLDPAEIVEAVFELEELGLVTADAGRPMTLAVIDAMARSGLSAYDAAYLVLAEASGARLLTADATLAAAAGDRAVLVGGDRSVGEPGTGYRVGPGWAAWRGATAYVARLRAEAFAER